MVVLLLGTSLARILLCPIGLPEGGMLEMGLCETNKLNYAQRSIFLSLDVLIIVCSLSTIYDYWSASEWLWMFGDI